LSDIKLFHFGCAQGAELPGGAMQVEKPLQILFEANLETRLGM